MKIELGEWYLTRNGMYRVRVVSKISKAAKGFPVVGEIWEEDEDLKRWVPTYCSFGALDLWDENGLHLHEGSPSGMDLVKVLKKKDEKQMEMFDNG